MSIDSTDPDPWHNRIREPGRGGPAFGDFIEAVRLLQDRITGARPPDDRVAALTAQIQTLADELLPWQGSEWGAAAGGRPKPPRPGKPILPPVGLRQWAG